MAHHEGLTEDRIAAIMAHVSRAEAITTVVCRALQAKERPDSEQEALTLEAALAELRDAYGALDALAVEAGRGTDG